MASNKKFFLWLQWDQGHGMFKKHGPRYGPARPRTLPKKIPLTWRIRKAAWLAKQPKKAPQALHLNPEQDPLWTRNGVYLVTLANYNERLRTIDLAKGYDTMYVLLASDPAAKTNLEVLIKHSERFKAEGWKIVGWAPAYKGTEDAKEAMSYLIRYPFIDGWSTNQEYWAEGSGAWITNQFVDEWLKWNARKPLAFSVLSSDTGNWARSFNYVKASKHRTWLIKYEQAQKNRQLPVFC